MNNPLIYGKDPVKRIVGSEVMKDYLINYIADGNKTITEKRPFYYYVLLEEYDDSHECGRLGGKNDFQYFVKFKTKGAAYNYCRGLDYEGKKYYRCYNPVESAMLREGFTFYKDMKVNDVSVLSFDIETTGVTINDESFVLLISNTYRSRSGDVSRRVFDFNSFDSAKDMLNAWCEWVRGVDPDIMLGHNIFNFDFPYLHKVATLNGTKLNLGRNASPIEFDRHTREFRKDGSQSYDYINASIFGREIVDTFFLSMKYDIGRQYPNYGLKAIIAHEGLQKADRQFWDFEKVREPWNNPSEWSKFIQYCKDDSDDALALFDLMIPQFFYYAQSIPKSFQEIINSATGSQVNSFMMRAYLQDSLAVPAATEKADFKGADVIGNPGLYKNVYKVDVASLYPSIMLSYEVADKKKDPENRFLQAVKFFTEQRLADKLAYKETGERIYKDLSDGRKIMINSFYGFMGAPGLNFNYPVGAALVTEKGREILDIAIQWCFKKDFRLVNADTDSISFEAPEGLSMQNCLAEINALSPKGISWEDDGIYDSFLVVKSKNYAMKRGDKVTIKGSGLKATMKEPALVKVLEQSIKWLLDGKVDRVYHNYVNHAYYIHKGIDNIKDWCSKKTVTKAVLTPKRKQEANILEALAGENIQEGDKYRMFFETSEKLCLEKNFKGEYDKDRLYEKLYNSIYVLAPVLDMENFLNYKLKRNKKLLEDLNESTR